MVRAVPRYRAGIIKVEIKRKPTRAGGSVGGKAGRYGTLVVRAPGRYADWGPHTLGHFACLDHLDHIACYSTTDEKTRQLGRKHSLSKGANADRVLFS
jgi:hypothetical protein